MPIDAQIEGCYGLLGMIQLLGGPYLLVIKEIHHRVGSLLGHPIYEIGKVDMWPIQAESDSNSSTTENANLTDSEARQILENEFLRLVKMLLTTVHLYFSPSLDLTRNMQRQLGSPEISFENLRRMYMANTALITPFCKDPAMLKFVMIAIHGCKLACA